MCKPKKHFSANHRKCLLLHNLVDLIKTLWFTNFILFVYEQTRSP